MKIDLSTLGTIFGDRVLVRKLERPEKVRGIIVPSSYSQGKTKEQDLWFGVVERFGLDSKIGDAYGIEVGDILGFESAGQHCSAFEGEDGETRVWVAEEFAAVKDLGRIKAFRDGAEWTDDAPGVQPLGKRIAIMPDTESDKSKGGIYVPDTASNAANTGVAIAVSLGEIVGSELERLVVEVGDHVLYGKYSGCYARLGKTDILFSNQDDVIGTFTPITIAKETANV